MDDPSVDLPSQDSVSSSASSSSIAQQVVQSNYDKADGFLSQEIFGLNAHSRNAIHEEIHGVRCMALEESPQFVLKRLEEFWAAVAGLPDSCKTAYRKCRRIANSQRMASMPPENNHNNKHYAIDDPSFHLRFLRSELFDAHKAATRYVNYLDFVHKLWGDVALEREIRFTDFTKEEAKLFRKGNYQLLPVRDQSGRKVLVCLRKMSFEAGFDETAKCKVVFYLWNSIAFRDVESQKKGVVVVVIDNSLSWNEHGVNRMLMRRSLQLKERFFAAIPIRIAAIHHCLPDNPLTRVVKIVLAMKITSQSQRLRFIFHLNQQQQQPCTGGSSAALYTRYKLKGYGIPIELLPFTESGTITTKNHFIWTKTRKFFEEGCFEEGSDGSGNGVFRVNFSNRDSPVSIVECPGSNDVLFRQGKTMIEHPGNVMFRNLILDYLDREEVWKAESVGGWDSKHGSQKIDASEQMGYGKQRFLNSWILTEIYEHRKGRFLEWDREKCVWVLLTDLSAIKSKISIVFSKFRNRKTKSLPSHPATTWDTLKEQQRGHSVSNSTLRVPRCELLGNGVDATDSAVSYRFVEGRMPGASLGASLCNLNRNALGEPSCLFLRSVANSTNSSARANTSDSTNSALALSVESSSTAVNRKRSRND